MKKKHPGVVIPTPEVLVCSIPKNNLQFLVLATDGLWDVMKNKEVGDFVRSRLGEGRSAQDIVEALIEEAYKRWLPDSSDDITIEIVVFSDEERGV